jgi:hypothetical protein
MFKNGLKCDYALNEEWKDLGYKSTSTIYNKCRFYL